MIILGINAYHGDASAALVVDGKLAAAVEEERFTRIKHCAGFPAASVRYCIEAAGIKPSEIDCIAVARDPRARLLRKAVYALRIPRLAYERLGAWNKFAGIKEEVANALRVGVADLRAEVRRVEHHQAHLASSFFVSPFDEAALFSVDGLGDFASTMWGVGKGSKLKVQGSIAFPHSLGIYYTALSQYLGFCNYGDEYKVMGLAAYGEPEYLDEFRKIVCLRPDNSENNGGATGFALGLDYFVHHRTGPEMTWREGAPLLGRLYSDYLTQRLGPGREKDSPVERRHENIAASLQGRLEDAVFSLLHRLYELTRLKKLCLAGGVAFNCVVNGKILEQTPFEKIYIPPAAGDAGLAVGAAYYVWHEILRKPRSFEMKHAYWGPEFSDKEICEALSAKGIEQGSGSSPASSITVLELPEGQLLTATAEQIAEGKIVGWFQGRMEFGPRALGNRSILVDPRRADMKEILNSRIKHREAFRPFAPSILEERTGDFFEQTHPSPFMLMTYRVRAGKQNRIPAPTHVDGTGRVQTVSREANPLYWQLIKEFERLTGVPALLNTSFNDNEPVVCRPEEALGCFLRTRMDTLVMGSHVVTRPTTEGEDNNETDRLTEPKCT
jgi:carbamoyltransferase